MIIIGWLVLSFIIAIAAKKRGRSFGGYLVLSLLLSPLITGIIVLLLGQKEVDTSSKAV